VQIDVTQVVKAVNKVYGLEYTRTPATSS